MDSCGAHLYATRFISYLSLSLQMRLPAIVLLLVLSVSCNSPRSSSSLATGGRITLTYWSATNAQELEFANKVSAEWNAQHPEVQIKVEPVPSGQSSEEVILAAIASGTTPDIYANVFPGAMQDLLDAQGLVQLDAYPDFFDVMHERMMPELLNQYRSSDGHFYQVPWKSNPIMVLYNTRMLREAGVSSLPTTYSEFLSAAARVTRDRDGDGQIDQWMLTIDYLPIWYKRLFDFLPLYLAASNGQNLLEGRRVRFDNESSVAVFRFLHECFARGYAPRQTFQGDVFSSMAAWRRGSSDRIASVILSATVLPISSTTTGQSRVLTQPPASQSATPIRRASSSSRPANTRARPGSSSSSSSPGRTIYS